MLFVCASLKGDIINVKLIVRRYLDSNRKIYDL